MAFSSSSTTIDLGDFTRRHIVVNTTPPPIPARSPLRNSLLVEHDDLDQQGQSGWDTPSTDEQYLTLDQQIDDTIRELNTQWPYDLEKAASVSSLSTHSQVSSRSRYSIASSVSARTDTYSHPVNSHADRAMSMSSVTSLAQLTTGSSRSDDSSYWDDYQSSRPTSLELRKPAFTPSIAEPEVSTDQIFDMVYDIPAIPYETVAAQRKPELLFPPHPAVRPMLVAPKPPPAQLSPDFPAATVPLALKSVNWAGSFLRHFTRDVGRSPKLDCIPTRTSSQRHRRHRI